MQLANQDPKSLRPTRGSTKKKAQIEWKACPEDTDLLKQIAFRAWELLGQKRSAADLERICMDLTACHLNGCPLRLNDMLWGNDLDLMHDITLIYKHIDRRTGKLTGFALPRYHKPLKEG